jgi:hypothetical protein
MRSPLACQGEENQTRRNTGQVSKPTKSGSWRSRAPPPVASWRYAFISPGNKQMNNRYNDRRHGRSSRPPDDQKSTRQRATDQEIQKWISRQHGFVPESAWIAHCKELFGLAAPGSSHSENPCPPEKVAAIKQAFRHFGLL